MKWVVRMRDWYKSKTAKQSLFFRSRKSPLHSNASSVSSATSQSDTTSQFAPNTIYGTLNKCGYSDNRIKDTNKILGKYNFINIEEVVFDLQRHYPLSEIPNIIKYIIPIISNSDALFQALSFKYKINFSQAFAKKCFTDFLAHECDFVLFDKRSRASLYSATPNGINSIFVYHIQKQGGIQQMTSSAQAFKALYNITQKASAQQVNANAGALNQAAYVAGIWQDDTIKNKKVAKEDEILTPTDLYKMISEQNKKESKMSTTMPTFPHTNPYRDVEQTEENLNEFLSVYSEGIKDFPKPDTTTLIWLNERIDDACSSCFGTQVFSLNPIDDLKAAQIDLKAAQMIFDEFCRHIVLTLAQFNLLHFRFTSGSSGGCDYSFVNSLYVEDYFDENDEIRCCNVCGSNHESMPYYSCLFKRLS